MFRFGAEVVQIILVHYARVRVTAHVHDDVSVCLVSVHVVEGEEVLRLIKRDHFTRLALDHIKPRRLLVVPLHALVKRPSLYFHSQQRPDIYNERILDEHKVVRRHGETVVVAEAVFRDEC